MTSPCPAEGAVLHGLEVEADGDGRLVYVTGDCEHCGEDLHEAGSRRQRL